MRNASLLLLTVLLLAGCRQAPPPVRLPEEQLLHVIDSMSADALSQGKIPGLSVVIIRHDSETIRNYGYADLAAHRQVDSGTEFQLGSCSKAFTSLAFLRLAASRNIDLDTDVAAYLPWFHPTYKHKPARISIRQLLHHTSGIPWQTLSMIPELGGSDALQRTVAKVADVGLRHRPGSVYEYATINYDILALLIQQLSGQSFEQYMQDSVFNPLRLAGTTIGAPEDSSRLATGYKIGFFKARPYDAPVFRGNDAAGYVISDPADVGRWLKFQLGDIPSPLFPLARQTHARDETVAPQGLFSYAMGWQVSLSGNGELLHTGLNPNYTAYMAIRPARQAAIAVLANSNSSYTFFLGDRIMKTIAGEEINTKTAPDSGSDPGFAIACVILACYVLLCAALLISRIIGVVRRKRRYQALTLRKAAMLLTVTIFMIPLLYGIWLAPKAIGFTWSAALVWTPLSFVTAAVLMAAAILLSYFAFGLSLFFPGGASLKNALTAITLVSILSGFSNMVLILLITSSFGSPLPLRYQVFYFLVIMMIYTVCRRYVQISLARLTRNIVYDIRIKVIGRIFSNSFRQFEKINKENIYSTLEWDIRTVGDSANTIVNLVTSVISVAGAFAYLATLTLWTTLVTIGLIVAISAIYTIIIGATKRFFEEARETQNVFLGLIGGMVDGFKEISLHLSKRTEYRKDFTRVTAEYSDKTFTAGVRMINASMLGESALISVLGAIAFAVPKLWPQTELYILTSFIIILLYLNGPLNVILTAIPAVMQLRIARGRIEAFMKLIPIGQVAADAAFPSPSRSIKNLRVQGLTFRYHNEEDSRHFAVGPVDFEVAKGQVLFIIGGNGSGKTTLVKLITGLYESDKGSVYVDGFPVRGTSLSEYYSVVFSPCYLFEKIYDIETGGRLPEIEKYLDLLGLTGKVEIRQNRFSTINLSGGQRKRMALLLCLLEDRPIYLFDEWAADQDPEYRRFFYREILPEMRRNGKIVIAVTHDDHYFDVADKILKMDMGRSEYVDNNFRVDHILAG